MMINVIEDVKNHLDKPVASDLVTRFQLSEAVSKRRNNVRLFPWFHPGTLRPWRHFSLTVMLLTINGIPETTSRAPLTGVGSRQGMAF